MLSVLKDSCYLDQPDLFNHNDLCYDIMSQNSLDVFEPTHKVYLEPVNTNSAEGQFSTSSLTYRLS